MTVTSVIVAAHQEAADEGRGWESCCSLRAHRERKRDV